MYTMLKDPLERLRAYRRELEAAYVQAIGRRDLEQAHRLRERRRSVQRAILLREEWAESPSGANELDAEVAAILRGAA
jgi:hypothetical protein